MKVERRRLRRTIVTALLFGAVGLACTRPAVAASAIDTLAAQMNEAGNAGRNADGLNIARRLEELVRRQQGTDNMNFAGVLHNEGMFLHNLGRYKEAADRLNAALAIKLHFHDAASILRTSNILISSLMMLERRSDALAAGRQALAVGTAAFGPDDPRLAGALESMGTIARAQENYGDARDFFERALAIKQRSPNISPPEIATALDDLGDLYGLQGRFDDGEKLLKQGLATLDQAYGAQAAGAPNYLNILNDLGNLYNDAGRLQDAEATLRKAYALGRERAGEDDPNVSSMLGNLANVLNKQSRYAEAEVLFNRTLLSREKTFGPDHPAVVYALNNLANNYADQGRAADALPLQQRVLAIQEKIAGPDSPDAARVLMAIASTYNETGRAAEAAPLYQRALRIFSEKLGSDSTFTADALGAIGRQQLDAGQFDAAGQSFARALAIQEKAFGRDHASLLPTLRAQGLLALRTGDYAAARSALERALAIALAKLGPDHLTTSAILINLSDVSAGENKWAEALATLRRAAERLAGRVGSGEATGLLVDLDGHLIRAVWKVSDGKPDDQQINEAFTSAQRLHETSAASAVTLMSARFAAGNDAVAAAVRRQQDLKASLDSLDKRITTELGAPDGKRNDGLIASLRTESGGVRKSLEETAARIAREFPAYAELSSPVPLSLSQVQALLKPDEAELLFLAMSDRSFVFAVTREHVGMRAIALRADGLADRVAGLRRGLFNGVAEVAPFDLDASHELYAALFSPISDIIAAKPKLLIVPTGALTSLPFQVLVTRTPDPATGQSDRYRSAAWLIRDKAIDVLPSVSSLRALRVYARASRASKPFIGFGDPVLQLDGGKTRMSRNVDPYSTYYKGTTVDIDMLRKGLAPLPETAGELLAVAHQLGASDADVRLGADATVTNVRLAQLDQYRVIDFATHGLVAGEVKGLSEPALVLTLPARPTADDDGLLTSSRVARLTLDADWAVLSACNTAAGDRPGAEGLSGLARAFFYAGARALLVSHWPVDSGAAVKLTTGAFSELAHHPGIGRAEALRRSMLALINDPSDPRNAEPALWAPFVLVGEGG
ncbi:CHAT domain-containing tetratricopeptide repeat protein [Bradyrhizobium jicamae]|uniref:CHAT domain-containing tetratricopeptide repeat protein n=1 Tax=Bradyrhizobium jicamae TaxID=280332 RepID=UPI001BA82108|nr:CHAT domain-containing tetratricopeptide repeat protein [Bradyrhizobium jicamae]MBR0932513.1 tetratricopeptide repeat protein [Bradyrhizobium jicamae]